jgi:hypothetical protein
MLQWKNPKIKPIPLSYGEMVHISKVKNKVFISATGIIFLVFSYTKVELKLIIK